VESGLLGADVVSLDGVDVRDLDFVDVGTQMAGSGAAAVTVKSLVF
jgi:ethanolamine utilization protein EutA (predicted chaperonin)